MKKIDGSPRNGKQPKLQIEVVVMVAPLESSQLMHMVWQESIGGTRHTDIQ